MKMIFCIFAFALASCTHSTPTPVDPGTTPTPSPSIACSLEQSLASVMANGVATTLSCTGTAQIQADILAAAGKANLCATVAASKKAAADGKVQGLVGNIVCPMLVDQVSAVGLSQIPASWGCSGGATVEQAKVKLTELCKTNISL